MAASLASEERAKVPMEFCWKAVTKILLLGRQRKCIALVEILGRLNDTSLAPLRHVRHE